MDSIQTMKELPLRCLKRNFSSVFRFGLLLIGAGLAPVLGWSEEAPNLVEIASKGEEFTPEFVQKLTGVSKSDYDHARDMNGAAMLHLLAQRSHQARILLPLLAGADPNVRDNRGRTPLFDCLDAYDSPTEGKADFMVMEMLVYKGADVNARASDGTTPLAIAVEREDFPKAEFLIWRGANIRPDGVTEQKQPLEIARTKKNQRIITLLENVDHPNAVKVSSPTITLTSAKRLENALTSLDFGMLEDLLADGWNINEQDEKGRTALFRAVQKIRADLTDYLIFLGADPNIPDKEGTTPLMLSMNSLKIEGQRMQALLILSGADVNAKIQKGETALCMAATTGHDWGVMYLYAAGADATAPTPKGSITEYATHPPTLWYLKTMGAADKIPSEGTATGDPAEMLCDAAFKGDMEKVKALLKTGVPVNMENRRNVVALTSAACSGHLDIIDLLLTKGADINYRNRKYGFNVLHYLAEWGVTVGDDKIAAKMIENLIARGANPDLAMNDGRTPLMRAAKVGACGANTEALLRAGAKINLRNKEGLTALGVARKFGQTEMYNYLQAHGALE